jgi:hypothetical protein
MTRNPWDQLGLSPEATEEAIRQRYLELVQAHPPERDPQRFAEVREAYEIVKDLTCRLETRFFQRGSDDSLVRWIEDVACHTPRCRHPLSKLLRQVLDDV